MIQTLQQFYAEKLAAYKQATSNLQALQGSTRTLPVEWSIAMHTYTKLKKQVIDLQAII